MALPPVSNVRLGTLLPEKAKSKSLANTLSVKFQLQYNVYNITGFLPCSVCFVKTLTQTGQGDLNSSVRILELYDISLSQEIQICDITISGLNGFKARQTDISRDRVKQMNLKLFTLFNWKCLSQGSKLNPIPNHYLSALIISRYFKESEVLSVKRSY